MLSISATAQLESHEFSELDSLLAVDDREVVVFIGTDWCKFCHKMENTTFKNDSLTKVLNDSFYFVKLDAEQKDDIIYRGHKFSYKPSGGNTGVHELAEQLGTVNGNLNYPTVSIVNTQNEIVFQYGGAMTANELMAVLNELLNQ